MNDVSNMNDMGAAVVGTGFIGPVHVEALRRLGVRVTGILGSSPEKSERARQSLNLETAYENFDALLNDAAVQAVHLAVPNVLHYEMAKRALEAGKHVMCEKPLAMNAAESSELVELAGATNLEAGVCYNIRYYPLNLEALDLIQRGDLGTIHSIVGSYAQDWMLYETDYNWRVLADRGGKLRTLSDIGTHWIDLVCSVSGLEVEAVCADLKTVHPVRKRPRGEVEAFSGKTGGSQDLEEVDITTEDFGSVMLRFKGGARGNLWVSQVTAGRKNCLRYEIAGSKCALSWNSERPNELWLGRRDEPNESLIRDPALVGDTSRRYINYPGGHNEGYPDTFKQCFRAFYDAIASGGSVTPMYPTFEDGHYEIVLCEAMLKSHREQQWITL